MSKSVPKCVNELQNSNILNQPSNISENANEKMVKKRSLFKTRLRDLMKESKEFNTNEKLAKAVSKAPTTIAKYRRPSTPIPRDPDISDLATVFGVDSAYLKGEQDEKNLKTSALETLTGLSTEACDILRQSKESPELTEFLNHLLKKNDFKKLAEYSNRFVVSQNSDIFPRKSDLSKDPNYRAPGDSPEFWLFSADNMFRDALKSWYIELEPEYRLERFYFFAHELFVVGEKFRDMKKDCHKSIKDRIVTLAANDIAPRLKYLKEMKIDSVIFDYEAQEFYKPSAELIKSYNSEIDHRTVTKVDLNRFKIQE